jgi:tRNA U34 5-methylaminomethyl-2-thiouridine-forming methyltransferase MnmC
MERLEVGNSSGTEIFLTKDGSHSVLHKGLNETYHSVFGALQESQHVFIENGLNIWLAENSFKEASVFEVGFGTGLNALLTLKRSLELQTPIHYATLEAFPLDENIWRKLNYADRLGMSEHFEQLHLVSWNQDHQIAPQFTFNKYYKTLAAVPLLADSFDVVFFDAFAPSKQPEMWHFDMLEKVVRALKQGGLFVTYCAKGQVKRDLKSLGLTVDTLPGPPGKKEMVRARRL